MKYTRNHSRVEDARWRTSRVSRSEKAKMGNNGSSSREQQAASVCSNGLVTTSEASRGWSQSFPRELARHHHRSQAPPVVAARMVLPEPPNQRLRATDNGSIIQNGGTISGRRAPTFSSSRDFAKRNEPFRERSISACQPAEGRSRRIDRHCCRYRTEQNRAEATSNLKRFDSEPDLRYSPDACSSIQDRSSIGRSSDREDGARTSNGQRAQLRESKERLEGRYKARKKYKAPAPPSNGDLADESLSTLGGGGDGETRCRLEQQQLQPPPRRSRLFKTRAETKKAQVTWQLSSGGLARSFDRARESASRTTEQNTDQRSASNRWNASSTNRFNEQTSDHRNRCKLTDGKNTLQRSMSSPEFQAELIQVARRVRDKLDCTGKSVGLEAADFEGRAANASTEEERSLVPAAPPQAEGKINHARSTSVDRDSIVKPTKPVKPMLRRLEDDETTRRRSGSYGKAVELARERTVTGASGPETLRDKENRDPGRRNGESNGARRKRSIDGERTDGVETDKSDTKRRSNRVGETTASVVEDDRSRQEHRRSFVSPTRSAPKTFYFGMNETRTESNEPDLRGTEEAEFKFPDGGNEDGRPTVDLIDDEDENERNVVENISLKLRPTLPKKQLEIPRFSPSAAWRLLSALEAPGPSMSTASEELPVTFEERIERSSRPPPPFPLSLGPRSWHDKSGDSGISGDAGAANDDSLDVSTINRMKTTPIRPAWTPQQDLGEESSSDAGVDSPPPPPLPTPFKYPPRAHVFSLSLPRDDARTYFCAPDPKSREGSAFNSLQKLKRSVSGAFGIGAHDPRTSSTRDLLDDNWLLSSSAPNSLQHNRVVDASRNSPSAWKPYLSRESTGQRVYGRDSGPEDDENEPRADDGHDDGDDGDEDEDEDDDEDDDEDSDAVDADVDASVRYEADGVRVDEDGSKSNKSNDFPVVMKPPSFSYLTPGGHVMYLPESNDAEHRAQGFNGEKVKRDEDEDEDEVNNDVMPAKRRSRNSRGYIDAKNSRGRKESLNCSEMYEAKRVSSGCEEVVSCKQTSTQVTETKPQRKSRRFTFQSTVRQIERRRLAEKLSREAEAKERQRKGELEAMRKVEEEFQRKRAKEKANIRQQLRLFKEMEENFDSLASPKWDGSQLSRADPDGAPSSTASSPTSMPIGNTTSASGKSFVHEEHRRKRNVGSDSKKRRAGEQAAHRAKYYDWAPDASSHLEHKQTTVHPKIVCDIPKSSPVFVDANVHPAKPVASNSTPRSDNYRKDFAHGAVITKTSFASSDSELSQPNTRPHSRQTGSNGKSFRAGSGGSPGQSEEPGTGDKELDDPVEAAEQPRKATHDFTLSGVQPFTKQKAYRPISFNPQPPPPVPS
ncbi:uncharacterized protein LOC143305915 isoform X1 [Osmia lignaria lignaria]|uniref:uncharacterized protein LOC143305915 isoform X1 n=2 Tax=Osmia lignaria lignaria TaxID=1437193 RepID=UPI00402B63B0